MPRGKHRFKHVRRDVLKGILFIAVALAIKLAIEHTTFGKHLAVMDYNLLQTQLSKEQVPFTIIDVSDLAQKDFVVSGEIVRATPRDPLKEMIKALADQRPKAIAIDIDFSPDQGRYILASDPEFFEFCQNVIKETGVPIILGIKRTIGDPAADWLGQERYQDLAASILVPRDTRRMASLIKVEEETAPGDRERRITTVPTMSKRLAEIWGQQPDRPAHALLLKLGLVERFSEQHLAYGVSPEDFLVDYGFLESIETIKATNSEVLHDQHDRIFGKLVLIGDATLGKASDVFSVPGREQPSPGIFLHACGAYTLITAPLYELTHTGRVVIDVLLSAVILVMLILVGLFYRTTKAREKATHELRGILTLVTVVTAIVVGAVFVRVTRIMWDDFFLALILLVFHPSIEERIEGLWMTVRKLFAWKSRSRAKKVAS